VVLWSQLRTSDRDASDGTLEALEQIVAAIRQRFPEAKIVVRGDSAFARDALLSWCEANGIFYCVGLARNSRLEEKLESAMAAAAEKHCLCGGSPVSAQAGSLRHRLTVPENLLPHAKIP